MLQRQRLHLGRMCAPPFTHAPPALGLHHRERGEVLARDHLEGVLLAGQLGGDFVDPERLTEMLPLALQMVAVVAIEPDGADKVALDQQGAGKRCLLPAVEAVEQQDYPRQWQCVDRQANKFVVSG